MVDATKVEVTMSTTFLTIITARASPVHVGMGIAVSKEKP